MEVGPPGSPCRRGAQTTARGVGKEPGSWAAAWRVKPCAESSVVRSDRDRANQCGRSACENASAWYNVQVVINFTQEVDSQPSVWRRSADTARRLRTELPLPGQRVAVVGCGTSWFMGQAFAAYRERQSGAETDAFAASEMPTGRPYDLVVALSRSGTTTEVLEVVEQLCRNRTPVIAVTAVGGSPLVDLATRSVVLDFADEVAVVQTRFATGALLLLLSTCGWDVAASAARAEVVLAEDPVEIKAFEQFVFVGKGMAAGLASEAALKLRESARAWSEAYPAMEFRHGPISAVGTHTLVWSLDRIDTDLAAQAEATGASVTSGGDDPVVELVRVHRAAGQLAAARGLDPDSPVHLTRSVILER